MSETIGIAYLRESEEDRKSKENSEDFVTTSIRNQEYDVIKEAKVDGVNSVKIFKDVNVHSTDTKRKGFEEMINYIKSLKVNPKQIRVYIKDYNRLGRGNAFFQLRRRIMMLSIPKENIFFFYESHWRVLRDNENTPIRANNEDDSIVTIKVGANLMQIERARRETLELQSRKSEQGLPYIKSPFGYKYNDKKVWVVDTKKAEIVKDIFHLTLNKINYKIICKKYGLFPQQYYKIIKDKNYLGLVSHTKKIKLDDGTVIRKELVVYMGKHEFIINPKVWFQLYPTDKELLERFGLT